jgi:hypothetical protein
MDTINWRLFGSNQAKTRHNSQLGGRSSRLSRASRFAPPVTSPIWNWSTRRPKKNHGEAHQRQITREAPALVGRSSGVPGFPALPACDVNPYGITTNRPSYSLGVMSQGRMTREAPVRTEPHPIWKPNRRASTKAHDEFRVKYLQQPRHQGLQFGEFPDAQKATRPGQLLRNPRLRGLSSRITQLQKS